MFSLFSSQWKKAEEKLERELREAEASESTEKKLKLVGGSPLSYPQNVLLNDFDYKLFRLKGISFCFISWVLGRFSFFWHIRKYEVMRVCLWNHQISFQNLNFWGMRKGKAALALKIVIILTQGEQPASSKVLLSAFSASTQRLWILCLWPTSEYWRRPRSHLFCQRF